MMYHELMVKERKDAVKEGKEDSLSTCRSATSTGAARTAVARAAVKTTLKNFIVIRVVVWSSAR